MKVLVIIPAFNEQENIERVIENLQRKCPQWDYLVVNDGSKDYTAEICRKNNYPLLDLPLNLGLAGAFQAGIRYAVQNGYTAALQFDGDGQHDPAYIQKMINKMEHDKLDIVIGSRFCNVKKPNTLRMAGSRFIALAIRITTGKIITDPTSGMRLYNQKMLRQFCKNINCSPEPDTISWLLCCGAKVAEVQVEMHERMAGTSYLNLSRSIHYMLNMFVSIFFIQFFRSRRTLL